MIADSSPAVISSFIPAFDQTWCLMPDAVEGAGAFDQPQLARALREIIYYYHSEGARN